MGVTLILWMTATSSVPVTTLERMREALAGLGLAGLGMCFVLATRNRTVERWFGGLNRVVTHHKWLAIISASALIVHALIYAIASALSGTPETLSGQIGSFALGLIVLIALVTLFYKKLAYEKWRVFHRLMLVAYGFGLYHVYASNKFGLLTFSPLGIWTGVTVAIGLVAGVFVVFFYRRTQFKHEGVVTQAVRLSPDVVELHISLSQPLEFAQGQYAFVRVFHEGLENAPHPFSMSGGDGRDIRLTIKASGDFTKDVYDSIAAGTKVTLEGPHGQMDFRNGGQRQLWIAGGIGITPFMAYLEQNEVDQDIELFYSYRDKSAGIYADYLAAYAQRDPHFKVHLVDASIDGRLDFTGYTLPEGAKVFLCGPPAMMEAYTTYFKNTYTGVEIVHEGFAFR
jgi:predicted ferric reductase